LGRDAETLETLEIVIIHSLVSST